MMNHMNNNMLEFLMNSSQIQQQDNEQVGGMSGSKFSFRNEPEDINNHQFDTQASKISVEIRDNNNQEHINDLIGNITTKI